MSSKDSKPIVNWESKSFDDEDVKISCAFRSGKLDCGDILAHEKYQKEGILGTLILPHSIVQYGFGWFRCVPADFLGKNPPEVSPNEPMTPAMTDDFSLKLLASIFITADSNPNFSKPGGLFELFKSDIKNEKSSQNTPDSSLAETPLKVDTSSQDSSLVSDKRTLKPEDQDNSSIKRAKTKFDNSPLCHEAPCSSPLTSDSQLEINSAADRRASLSKKQSQEKADSSNLSSPNTSKPIISEAAVSSPDNQIKPVQETDCKEQNGTPKAEDSKEHSEKKVDKTPSPDIKPDSPNGTSSLDKEESLTEIAPREPWQDIEKKGFKPQSIPSLRAESEDSYWESRYTPRPEFPTKMFAKYAIHLFTAARTKAEPLSKEIDLEGSPDEVADRMVGVIRSIYSLQDDKKISHDLKATVNQALCVIGLYLRGKSLQFGEAFVLRNHDSTAKKVSSASRIATIADFVARVWDRDAPISRMTNLHVNFYKLYGLLGSKGSEQIESAILHLKEKYPPT